MRERWAWAVVFASVAIVPVACGSSGGSPGGASTDASTGDGSNPPGCPASLPTGACSSDGLVCNYPDNAGGCGGGTTASCSGGQWQLSSTGGPPTNGSCPETPPQEGTSCGPECGAALSCSYSCAQTGGTNETATCVGGSWQISQFASPCAVDAGLADAPQDGPTEGGADGSEADAAAE
jgi:hypothetical protein